MLNYYPVLFAYEHFLHILYRTFATGSSVDANLKSE